MSTNSDEKRTTTPTETSLNDETSFSESRTELNQQSSIFRDQSLPSSSNLPSNIQSKDLSLLQLQLLQAHQFVYFNYMSKSMQQPLQESLVRQENQTHKESHSTSLGLQQNYARKSFDPKMLNQNDSEVYEGCSLFLSKKEHPSLIPNKSDELLTTKSDSYGTQTSKKEFNTGLPAADEFVSESPKIIDLSFNSATDSSGFHSAIEGSDVEDSQFNPKNNKILPSEQTIQHQRETLPCFSSKPPFNRTGTLFWPKDNSVSCNDLRNNANLSSDSEHYSDSPTLFSSNSTSSQLVTPEEAGHLQIDSPDLTSDLTSSSCSSNFDGTRQFPPNNEMHTHHAPEKTRHLPFSPVLGINSPPVTYEQKDQYGVSSSKSTSDITNVSHSSNFGETTKVYPSNDLNRQLTPISPFQILFNRLLSTGEIPQDILKQISQYQPNYSMFNSDLAGSHTSQIGESNRPNVPSGIDLNKRISTENNHILSFRSNARVPSEANPLATSVQNGQFLTNSSALTSNLASSYTSKIGESNRPNLPSGIKLNKLLATENNHILPITSNARIPSEANPLAATVQNGHFLTNSSALTSNLANSYPSKIGESNSWTNLPSSIELNKRFATENTHILPITSNARVPSEANSLATSEQNGHFLTNSSALTSNLPKISSSNNETSQSNSSNELYRRYNARSSLPPHGFPVTPTVSPLATSEQTSHFRSNSAEPTLNLTNNNSRPSHFDETTQLPSNSEIYSVPASVNTQSSNLSTLALLNNPLLIKNLNLSIPDKSKQLLKREQSRKSGILARKQSEISISKKSKGISGNRRYDTGQFHDKTILQVLDRNQYVNDKDIKLQHLRTSNDNSNEMRNQMQLPSVTHKDIQPYRDLSSNSKKIPPRCTSCKFVFLIKNSNMFLDLFEKLDVERQNAFISKFNSFIEFNDYIITQVPSEASHFWFLTQGTRDFLYTLIFKPVSELYVPNLYSPPTDAIISSVKEFYTKPNDFRKLDLYLDKVII